MMPQGSKQGKYPYKLPGVKVYQASVLALPSQHVVSTSVTQVQKEKAVLSTSFKGA